MKPAATCVSKICAGTKPIDCVSTSRSCCAAWNTATAELSNKGRSNERSTESGSMSAMRSPAAICTSAKRG